MLMFLWKWKVATTTALGIRFYPNAKLTSAHIKLWQLADAGYIRSINSVTGSGCVWTLTDKGFNGIKDQLPAMKQSGYKSEAVGHDLLSMAAMVGDWIQGEPPGVKFYTEQQLRRIDPSLYPMWVPQTDVHRADGYWRLPKLAKDSSLAIEIERSQKALKSYELVADFYESYDFVKGVIWITPMPPRGLSLATRILKYLDQSESKHSFIALEDFTKLGWQAPVRIGKHKGATLSKIMETFSEPVCNLGYSRSLLETRKKPLILDPEHVTNQHSFFN